MVHEFTFPDVGEGVTEGTLIKWLVSEGDAVEEDESLAEVETDKAIVEVPSPETATILKLHAEEGDTIKVGEVLVTLGEEGEEAPAAEEAESGAEAAEAEAEPSGEEAEAEEAPEPDEAEAGPAEEASREQPGEPGEEETAPEPEEEEQERRESTSIVGELEEAPDEPAEAAEPEPPEEEPSEEADGEQKGTTRKTLATPSTRRVAREKGVSIDTVKGTGPGGRVTKEDVERAAEGGVEAEAGEAAASAPEAEAPAGRRFEPKEYDFAQWGDVEREQMSGTRKAIARAMERSTYTAPHVTHTDDADVTELWAVRKKEKHMAEEKGVHLTFLPFIARACISALKDYPLMNSSLDEQTQELVKKDYYTIGMAVATDDGLLVPNVKDADKKSILALGREMNELAQQARDRELTLDQMRGGTFTITNYGSIGGRYGTPIINYPEVGILGVGTIRDEPVVKGENVKVRKILPLSLSFDHRVIDGAYAAQFMNAVVSHLEDPDLLMIDE